MKTAPVIAAVATLGLAACGSIPVRESSLGATLPAQTAPIIVGQTDRAAVRELLGTPWLSSEYWGFDVYRSSDANTTVAVAFMVPFMYSNEDVSGYVLVDYDSQGKVAAHDYGIAGSGSLYRSTSANSVGLSADGIQFRASADGKVTYVAVVPPSGDEYLRTHPAKDRCRVLIGSVRDSCGTEVVIDGKSVIELPIAAVGWLPSMIAPLELQPGNRLIKFSPGSWMCSFEAEIPLNCVAGETQYVLVDLTSRMARTTWSVKARILATATVAGERPAAFDDQALMIYANGQWLVPVH